MQADIDGCIAVHEAVGGTMALMLDASWAYSYAEALTVGRAIEELGFTWYEDPLPAEDIYGCRKLAQHLDIPIFIIPVIPPLMTTSPRSMSVACSVIHCGSA